MTTLQFENNDEIIEILAELEHEQWMSWSKCVSKEVSDETRKKWESSWIPYQDLTEEMKEKDRVWAVKVLSALDTKEEDKPLTILICDPSMYFGTKDVCSACEGKSDTFKESCTECCEHEWDSSEGNMCLNCQSDYPY